MAMYCIIKINKWPYIVYIHIRCSFSLSTSGRSNTPGWDSEPTSMFFLLPPLGALNFKRNMGYGLIVRWDPEILV
jgi:hypothetical protein